jgi:hypothetical protein
MNKGAPNWFHNVSNYGEVIEYWKIIVVLWPLQHMSNKQLINSEKLISKNGIFLNIHYYLHNIFWFGRNNFWNYQHLKIII